MLQDEKVYCRMNRMGFRVTGYFKNEEKPRNFLKCTLYIGPIIDSKHANKMMNLAHKC